MDLFIGVKIVKDLKKKKNSMLDIICYDRLKMKKCYDGQSNKC